MPQNLEYDPNTHYTKLPLTYFLARLSPYSYNYLIGSPLYRPYSIIAAPPDYKSVYLILYRR